MAVWAQLACCMGGRRAGPNRLIACRSRAPVGKNGVVVQPAGSVRAGRPAVAGARTRGSSSKPPPLLFLVCVCVRVSVCEGGRGRNNSSSRSWSSQSVAFPRARERDNDDDDDDGDNDNGKRQRHRPRRPARHHPSPIHRCPPLASLAGPTPPVAARTLSSVRPAGERGKTPSSDRVAGGRRWQARKRKAGSAVSSSAPWMV